MKTIPRIWMLGISLTAALPAPTHADEQLFGFTRGAETLPQGRSELYQFVTFRTGKHEGDYYGFDFETEIEHGFTDQFQASLSVDQHYFKNRNVNGNRDALDDMNTYRF